MSDNNDNSVKHNLGYLFGVFKYLIGLALLAIACCCDGGDTWYYIRCITGLIGVYILLGNCRKPVGYIAFFIIGMIGYLWSMQSGPIDIFTFAYDEEVFNITLDSWVKLATRLTSATIFILGYKSIVYGKV